MDIKTLKIGQIVLLDSSGHFKWTARVLEITPTNVIVEGISRTGTPEAKFRFDINGRAVDSRDLGYDDTTCWDYITPGTYEGGPWEIMAPGTYEERLLGSIK